MSASAHTPLSARQLLAYGGPIVGLSFLLFFVQFYFLKYATDTLLLPPAAVGALFALAKLWDAISNPIVGSWSDRTRTQLGRRRPFLFGALPLLGGRVRDAVELTGSRSRRVARRVGRRGAVPVLHRLRRLRDSACGAGRRDEHRLARAHAPLRRQTDQLHPRHPGRLRRDPVRHERRLAARRDGVDGAAVRAARRRAARGHAAADPRAGAARRWAEPARRHARRARQRSGAHPPLRLVRREPRGRRGRHHGAVRGRVPAAPTRRGRHAAGVVRRLRHRDDPALGAPVAPLRRARHVDRGDAARRRVVRRPDVRRRGRRVTGRSAC